MTTFIDALPEGYDDRTRLALRDDNQIVATHPEHPALLLLPNGRWGKQDALEPTVPA